MHLYRYIFIFILFFSCAGKNDDTIRYLPDPDKDYTQIELKLLEDALADDPDDEELLYKRAQLYFKLKDLEKALIDISKAIVEKDDDEAFYLLKAKILVASQQYKEALNTLQVAEKYEIDNLELNLVRAEIYLNLKDYRLALDKAHRAQRLMPSD